MPIEVAGAGHGAAVSVAQDCAARVSALPLPRAAHSIVHGRRLHHRRRWYRSRMKIANTADSAGIVPLGALPRSIVLLALAATLTAAHGAGSGAPAPRHLLVQVRDTPPLGHAAVRHGADGSYTVSTGGSGERDERGAQAPDNGTTLSTGNSVRRVHIVEGQRVRVDLPAVQSLQFHVPLPAAGNGKRAAGASAGAASAGTTTGTNTGTTATASGTTTGAAASAAPSVSGVVYFDSVAAFAARFALSGSTVRIELQPLRSGTVAAPYAAAAGDGADRPVVVVGRVGEWIALGDTDLQDPGATLNVTAEPPRPASVWVRVDPEAAEAAR